MVNYHASSSTALPALGRQISGYPPASGSKTILTWIPLCCLFPVASLGTLLSMFRWFSSFLLQRIGGFDSWSSYWWCDVNKKQGCSGGRKNNRLIGKKLPNPAGIQEENQGRKDLVVVQSSRINLYGQWCAELLPLQSTIVAKVTPKKPHPTAFSQVESPCYYSPPV